MISNRIRELYLRADRVSGNRLDIIRDAVDTFIVTRAGQASASLAYYVIFSLFPLLLVLIAAGSFFLDSQQVYLTVTQLVQQTFPATSYDWIVGNLLKNALRDYSRVLEFDPVSLEIVWQHTPKEARPAAPHGQ